MLNHELERANVASLIKAYASYIKEVTPWWHKNIGLIHEIKDVTSLNEDDDISLSEIFLRDVELIVQVQDKDYIEHPEQLLEQIEIKKLALSHEFKKGLLKYSFIDPELSIVSEEENLLMIKGKLPGEWKDIEKHFKDYNVFKCDINKYFETKTLMHIAKGASNGSIVNKRALETLLGKTKMPKMKIDPLISSKYMNNLDESKQRIFKAAASKNDILLIKGPPGTGKTRAITELIKHFVYEKNQKVILASRTHAALDNVIMNLSITPSSDTYTGLIVEKSSSGDANREFTNKDSLMVRNIRSRLLERIPKDGTLSKLMKSEFGPRVSSQRFLATPRGFSHPSLFAGTITSNKLEKQLEKGYKFDESILIMDEVSKSSIIDVLRYGMYAKKIILVGDDMQLSPIPQKDEDYLPFYNTLSDKEKNTYDQLFKESVFKRLYSKDANDLMFTTTYRSPEYVLKLYNEMAYENKIISKVKHIDPLVFKNSEKDQKMINLYSKANLILWNNSKAFHHRDESLSERSKINVKEMEDLLENLKFLSSTLKNRMSTNVMVMFVYKDQYKKFFRLYNKRIKYYEKRFASFRYGTIDQLQGAEADVVFLATTYAIPNRTLSSNAKYKTQLQDVRRLNVALSRTKNKFIVFANVDAYKGAPIFDGQQKINYTFDDIFNKFDARGNK